MTAPPLVSIGLPVYNGQRFLSSALDSLLSQTFDNFELIISDDASTDSTLEICQEYAAKDDRITLLRQRQRNGQIRNFRSVFEKARGKYFAWASDHDWWGPQWMSTLVQEMERNPDVLLIYPLSLRISETGEVLRRPWKFDTSSISNPFARLLASCWKGQAGSMAYGLFRKHELSMAGVYRLVIAPDRLLLAELAWHGRFKQVPQVLWHRRFDFPVSWSRQRSRSFLPGHTPLYTYLPWWVTHTATLTWNLVIRGSHRPPMGRGTGILFVVAYLSISCAAEARTWASRGINLLPESTGGLVRGFMRRLVPGLHRTRP